MASSWDLAWLHAALVAKCEELKAATLTMQAEVKEARDGLARRVEKLGLGHDLDDDRGHRRLPA